jgi:hypothetical protein
MKARQSVRFLLQPNQRSTIGFSSNSYNKNDKRYDNRYMPLNNHHPFCCEAMIPDILKSPDKTIIVMIDKPADNS